MAVVVAAVVAVVGYPSWAALSSPASDAPARSGPATGPSARGADGLPRLKPAPRSDSGGLDGALGVADGAVPDGATVFDEEFPAVANLDPDLLQALQRAATDAARDGITFRVNSGWRSRDHQDRLLRDAVSEYGSETEAARWVATADTSRHVSGDAIDIGPADATAWLSEHSADHGLCQTYRNEPWHFELRPDAVETGCPPMYDDPTQDPRMQQ